jgi:hypothetical protein
MDLRWKLPRSYRQRSTLVYPWQTNSKCMSRNVKVYLNRDTGLVGFNRDVKRAIVERVKFCHSFLVMPLRLLDHLQWTVLQAINHLDHIRKTINLSEPLDDAFDPIGNRKWFSFIPPIYPVNMESSLEQFGSILRQFDAFFDLMRSKPKHQILVFVFYKGFS